MNNNRIWILGTAIVSLAIVALGLVLGVMPKLAATTAATANLVGVQQQIADNQAQLDELATQFKNIGKIQDQLDELRAGLPADGAYPAFVDELNELSAETGCVILSYSQTAPLVYGPTTADGGTAETPITGGSLVAIPADLECWSPETTDGGFAFMDKLRLGERLVLIKGFKSEHVQDTHGSNFYRFILHLYVYSLVDPGTQVQPTVPTDPTASPTETPVPTDTATPSPTPTPTP